MFIIPFLFVVLIIIFITILPNQTQQNNNNSFTSNAGSNNHDRAIQILKERYAKGEISDEEYEKIKRNLM